MSDNNEIINYSTSLDTSVETAYDVKKVIDLFKSCIVKNYSINLVLFCCFSNMFLKIKKYIYLNKI